MILVGLFTGLVFLITSAFFCPDPDDNPNTENPAPFDVVINEIMARPVPSAGLPEAEYVELFNRSPYPVNLQNWTITVGTVSRILTGARILNPGNFLLIAHEKFKAELETFGDIEPVPAFPVLAAGGQTIVLRDDRANVISSVKYSDKWYGNHLKAQGGWSLEQLDPLNPCGGSGNWKASEDPRGGTPGCKNSVTSLNRDKTAPEIKRATVISRSSLRLHFSEPMHPWSDWSPNQFFAEGLGNPLYCIPVKPFFETVDLLFGREFDENTVYLINTRGNIFDCAGNAIGSGDHKIRFALPGYPEKNEIIINEILFNPLPGGADFIELVNISKRTFDLKQLSLTGMKPEPSFIVAPGGYLLFPDDYIILTTDPETVKNHYYVPFPDSFVIMAQMPPMNNESGRVLLTGLMNDIIDDVSYTSAMHSPLLNHTRGVSLERLSFKKDSSQPSNWHSASEDSGFATPGYRNSQYSEGMNSSPGIISVEPRIFSPDNSGYDDLVNIFYELDKPGYACNINIFDSKGRLVKRLVRNQLLGTTGTYTWNGRDEANRQSGLGIYIIMMEIYHPDGGIKKFKESVVLAGRLRN
jgi:hypothetical protein